MVTATALQLCELFTPLALPMLIQAIAAEGWVAITKNLDPHFKVRTIAWSSIFV
jgi:hypothetical protein